MRQETRERLEGAGIVLCWIAFPILLSFLPIKCRQSYEAPVVEIGSPVER